MERIEFLSAVLITSSDASRLATFYRDLLGLPLVEEHHGGEAAHWGCELGDIHFAIHPGPASAGGGGLRLALWVFDLATLVGELERRGVVCKYPIAKLGEGSLATAIEDPDGNLVELTQMSVDWVGHLSERRRQGADVVARSRERGGRG